MGGGHCPWHSRIPSGNEKQEGLWHAPFQGRGSRQHPGPLLGPTPLSVALVGPRQYVMWVSLAHQPRDCMHLHGEPVKVTLGFLPRVACSGEPNGAPSSPPGCALTLRGALPQPSVPRLSRRDSDPPLAGPRGVRPASCMSVRKRDFPASFRNLGPQAGLGVRRMGGGPGRRARPGVLP